ncbi:Rhomboid family [Proteiniphilum saccharofermentans]|uniref:Rhomboid family n=1 Tax=Proteiniphilum saccharofermentans TaxID=1642647 RepID=A0A1R3SZ31_9BACT|nr:rhomboid family intramembrane serine protease [Proteiniphilum saccharofermentans]SCD19139.1 Rhomboid family [Proteiniphilum saccharofermentans]SFS98276.1 Membrane associated serine protease, rhomboid family [Porphyromonadaceae bacterium NLAE-zl-C104]
MADFIERLKHRYKTGSVMTRLIFINVFVFIVLKIINVIFTLFNIYAVDLITFLGVPSHIPLLMNRIWTLITYMFVHEGFLHLLFNMLWLYWFGQIFMQYFTGRTLGSLYVLGGLAGALLYVIAFNTIPYYTGMERGWMIGASAAVMAIVMGAAFYRPDVQLNLLFLGPVKIVYIAIFAFVLDFLSLGNPMNPGGHVAHIGGALLGYLFAIQYKKGKDITRWIGGAIDWFVGLFKPRRQAARMKVKHARHETDWEYNQRKHTEQEEIDAILDKLKQSGYSSLSSEEKRKLFDASKK